MKIAAIDLYTDEATQAKATAWFDAQGITYNVLYYGTEERHPKELVLSPLRQWGWVEGQFTVTDFPFITFIEQNLNESDPRKWPLHFMAGPDFTPLLALIQQG